MKRNKERALYNRIIATAEKTLREFKEIIDVTNIRPKIQEQILLAVKRHNVAWKRLCVELAGISWLGLQRAVHSHVREKRLQKLKAAGVPAWKRSGWRSEQKHRDYHRDYIRKRRAKKRRSA